MDNEPMHGGDLSYEELRMLLLRLWTKAVGTEGYHKADWRQLEEAIEQLWAESRRVSQAPRQRRASMPDIIEARSPSEDPPAGYEVVPGVTPRSFSRIRR